MDNKITAPAPKPPSYIGAVIVMALLGIAGILGIGYIRPNEDLIIISAVIIGFLTPTTTSILAFMKSQETHLMVNSRLTEFIEAQAEVSEMRGEKIGRKKAEDRADAVVKRDKK